jgi:RNA polymerase subunit RPABC4/transcription elongation factor Spt4
MSICNWCGDKDTTDIWKSHICIENKEGEQ